MSCNRSSYDSSKEGQINELWGYVRQFYNSVKPEDDYEKAILHVNGVMHVAQVRENVKALYKMMGHDVSIDVLAAATCHDLGYLIYHFDDPHKYLDTDIGKYHHIYSKKAAEGFLKKAGFSDEEIAHIKKIIEAHDGGELSKESQIEYKIMYLADKLTRLGKPGLERLCAARDYNPRKPKKALIVLDKVEKRMDQTYAQMKELGILSEYIEKKYIEGKKALEQRRAQLQKAVRQKN